MAEERRKSRPLNERRSRIVLRRRLNLLAEKTHTKATSRVKPATQIIFSPTTILVQSVVARIRLTELESVSLTATLDNKRAKLLPGHLRYRRCKTPPPSLQNDEKLGQSYPVQRLRMPANQDRLA